jgi:predicted small lipoprotein YifL
VRRAVGLLAILLGGCGLRGELYLPPEPLGAETPGADAAVAAPAPEPAGDATAPPTADEDREAGSDEARAP